jgi:hypothetical protein
MTKTNVRDLVAEYRAAVEEFDASGGARSAGRS